MDITWFGHAAFGLRPENGPKIITDPYTPEGVGYAPIKEPADLVIISSDDDSAHCRADLIAGDPSVVNALTVAQSGGSMQSNGIEITAIEAAEWDHHPEHEVPGQNGMYRFTLDGIKCAHMGDVGNPLTDAQQAFFKDTDILFALAGGYLTLELPDLMEMIHRTRPKLVIPMHFRTLTYRPRNTMWIESFLAHFKDDDVDFAFGPTHTITKDDLPDRTRVLVMDYVR
ncbi:MBL fold metallo-hydrolase [Nereida sp. MMG025]|uniref:MBL fold metallo-hydrolase n=1 Tax=Nereida sp. MMG025 TaxID=2909981 RepID=UPI001F234F3A|nr:MBL fold metallo-hydrolase [Nereida sp. MMG025]MCF6445883.1 MBL fold metallo-hydrolase [Nereida sp. MMG025]